MNDRTAPAPARPMLVARRSPLRWIGSVLSRPLAAIAAAYLVLIVAVSALAPVLPFADPLATDYGLSFAPPSWEHPFGTDSLGRDVLSRLAHGGLDPLGGAVIVVLVGLGIGVPLGAIAGYFGRAVDWILSRVIEVMLAVPGLVILLVVLTVFPNNSHAAMVAFGVLIAAPIARLVRVETLRARHSLHVDASRVAGVGSARILAAETLPLLAGPLLVQATVVMSAGIGISTGLGFLGFGPQPPTPTWGSLITDASDAVSNAPWMLVPTGLVVILTILALNVIGDTVRDVAVEPWAGAPSRGRRARAAAAATPPAPSAPTVPVASAAADDPAAPADAVLEVAGLTVAFGETSVVDDVSFRIGRGEIVALVGESGCGKTITGRAVIGLLPSGARIASGSVRFEGEELVGAPASRLRAVRGRGIAYISQNPMTALDPSFTVGSLVGEAVRRHEGLRGRALQARVEQLLAAVALPDPRGVARKHPHQISGGMAQRVAIARALAGRPALLIADEPTTALDVTVQAGILDLLHDLRDRTGMAVIFVTHDWGVVADVADRAVVMYAGQVVESAELVALFDRPQHPYTAGLLGSHPENVEPLTLLPAMRGSVPSPEHRPVGCRFAGRCPFVTDDCRATAIPLLHPAEDRVTRCIHPERIPIVSGVTR